MICEFKSSFISKSCHLLLCCANTETITSMSMEMHAGVTMAYKLVWLVLLSYIHKALNIVLPERKIETDSVQTVSSGLHPRVYYRASFKKIERAYHCMCHVPFHSVLCIPPPPFYVCQLQIAVFPVLHPVFSLPLHYTVSRPGPSFSTCSLNKHSSLKFVCCLLFVEVLGLPDSS